MDTFLNYQQYPNRFGYNPMDKVNVANLHQCIDFPTSFEVTGGYWPHVKGKGHLCHSLLKGGWVCWPVSILRNNH